MLLKQRQVPERSSGTSLIHQVRNHNVGSNPTLPTNGPFVQWTGRRSSKAKILVRIQQGLLKKCRSGGMVDTLALGASTERCVGSSPTFDTKGSVVLNEQNFCLLSREMSVRIRLDPQKIVLQLNRGSATVTQWRESDRNRPGLQNCRLAHLVRAPR